MDTDTKIVDDPVQRAQLHDKYWREFVEAFEWPQERSCNSIAALLKNIGLAPGENFRLREGLSRDGAGQFWEYFGTFGKVRNFKTGEVRESNGLTTPIVSGTFPEEVFGWVPCSPQEGFIRESRKRIQSLEETNTAIRAFLETRRDNIVRFMEWYAVETATERLAEIRRRDNGPEMMRERDDQRWTYRLDGTTLCQALHIEATPPGHEIKSDGRILIAIHNWLEELAGIPPQGYCY